jgi:CRISPR/Cas system CSM-associated protein Csm5 (group 7 of RAMP superfamily)
VKNDYFLNDGYVAVLDAPRFVGQLSPDELDKYLEFLRDSSSRRGFQDFLDENPQLKRVAQKSVLYSTDTRLAQNRSGMYQYLDVFCFVKDAYNCPYVPGSSVKGMLRTTLLTALILGNRQAYAGLYKQEAARGSGRGHADRDIERAAFWREHPDSDDRSVVNDVMRYVSVSDSQPLSTADLVFVKKYDKFSKRDSGRHKKAMGKISDAAYYEGNDLNIYRECLKPGARIEVALDVDERIDQYLGGIALDRQGLQAVFEQAYSLYADRFLGHFECSDSQGGDSGKPADDGRCRYTYASGPLTGTRCRNSSVGGTGFCNKHQAQAASSGKQLTCYLGGGIDFDSKTVVNALFEDPFDAANETSHILYEQFPTKLDPSIHRELQRDVRGAGYEPKPMRAIRKGDRLVKGKEDHRHWRDVEFGVSPHTLKLGKVGKARYPMGKCTLVIEELG